MLRRLRSFWRAAAKRKAFEDEMAAEMRFHLESRAADLVRRGLTPEDAARTARREFGGLEKHKDLARASLGLRLFDEITGDLRYALRGLVRSKAFTATAVVTLALGIGANTAIFSLIDGLMLRPLPVPRPQDLRLLVLDDPGNKGKGPVNQTFSYPLLGALDERRDVFTGVAGFSSSGTLTVGAGPAISRASRAFVTGGFFETLGLTPMLGRLLSRSDDMPGAPVAAVISEGYWARAFGRDPNVVGRAILLDGAAAEIVGVSPRGFSGTNVGATADVTLAVAALPVVEPTEASLLGPGNFWLRALARLRPGLAQEAAVARLSSEWSSIVQPAINPKWSAARQKELADARVWFTPGATGWTYLREMYLRPLQVLMGTVALVLLIACANVASLILARGVARRREIAVRIAIGAGRGRIVRQLLVESATLALAGAAGGVLLAWLAGRALVNVMSAGGSALVLDVAPDGRILVFTAVSAIATALLFGMVPALQVTASRPDAVLKQDRHTGSAGSRLLPSLVTTQMALSLILLVGAGLFIRTLRNLHAQDPGFSGAGVFTARLEPRPGGLPAGVLDELRGLPGVLSASASTDPPMSGSIWSEPAVPAGQPLPEEDTAVFFGVSPDFFATLRIPVLTGRTFTAGDTRAAPPVAIVNEKFARRYFSGRPAVDRRLAYRHDPQVAEIVGVVADIRVYGLRDSPPPTVYLPHAQLSGDVRTTIEVRTAGPLNGLDAALRRILQPLSPRAPVEVQPMASQIEADLIRERMMATLGAGFGLLALVLAAVGVYGLLAYTVARRAREIGIRMALGARPSGVIVLVLRRAYVPVLIGVAVGAPAAWLMARSIASMLYGLTPLDPIAIGGAILALALIAHLAACLPARRAARVDPLIALRSE